MDKGLPSGTVIFLFTDIEGSTGIIRELGERYSDLLGRHNRLLRDVWRRHRGVEVATQGDAFFVAFADASDAIAATLDAQRVLAASRLADGTPDPGADGSARRLRPARRRRLPGARRAPGGPGRRCRQRWAGAGHRRGAGALRAETIGRLVVTDLGRYRVRDFDEPISLYRLSAPDVAGDTAAAARPSGRQPQSGPARHVDGQSCRRAGGARRAGAARRAGHDPRAGWRGQDEAVDRGRDCGGRAMARRGVVRRPRANLRGRGRADGDRRGGQCAARAGQRRARPTSWPTSPIAPRCSCWTTANISPSRSAAIVAELRRALPAARRARHEPRPARSDRRATVPARPLGADDVESDAVRLFVERSGAR